MSKERRLCCSVFFCGFRTVYFCGSISVVFALVRVEVAHAGVTPRLSPGTGPSVFRCVHCRARPRGAPGRAGQDRSGRARWSRRVSPRSGSAATRTRSGPARPCSMRSSGSFPKRAAIPSTARRTRLRWPPRSRQVQGQAREHRPRRRIAGDPEERHARVHVAEPRPRDRRRRPSRTVRVSRKRLGHPVAEIKVDAAFRLDLEPMIAACQGARASSSSTTRTTRPRPCTARRAVTDFVKRDSGRRRPTPSS